MNAIARLREGIKSFYASYDVYIRPVLKFAMAVLIFIAINGQLGYMNALNNLFVILILSVICAILPLNGIVVIGTALIVAHCFGLGLEVGGFALILYVVMVLLYFRFVPKDAIILLLSPVAFVLNIPLIIPLTAGLLCGPISAISVICGLISWQFIHVISTSIEPMKNSADYSLLDVLQAMPQALVSRDIILLMITFVVIMLVVTVIRKLLSSHSWEVAIVIGSLLYVFLMMSGANILGTEIVLSELVFGTVVAALIALILEFFFYNADYSGSEYLQFEDDKYYYHVKVIPKILPPEDDYDDYDELAEEEYEESRPRRRRRAEQDTDRMPEEENDRRRRRDRLDETDGYDSRRDTGSYDSRRDTGSYDGGQDAAADTASRDNAGRTTADGDLSATAVYRMPADSIPADDTILFETRRADTKGDSVVTDETKKLTDL